MAEGQALALISDAGTPLISDPGYKLVAEAIAAGLAVTAAPGASAALAALCVAGLPTDRFFFEGFLPPKSAARRERINALARVPGHARLLRGAEPARRVLGRSRARTRAAARGGGAGTDQAARGGPAGRARRPRGGIRSRRPAQGRDRRRRRPPGSRGRRSPRRRSTATSSRRLRTLSVRDAAAAVAARHGLPRRQVYARALALAGGAR